MHKPNPTAAILIIGNEILSGRTADKNVAHIARVLGTRGISVGEARIISDHETLIIAAVNHLRTSYDYVFTTGGIGATHDDITAAAMARAFDLPLMRHPQAVEILDKAYHSSPHVTGAENFREIRLKMAEMPEGAELIHNPVTPPPGFRVENVYVMAGVPHIMQGMLDSVLPTLRCGRPFLSSTFQAPISEGRIARRLADIQDHHLDVTIGSYPHYDGEAWQVSIVLRSTDAEAIRRAEDDVKTMFRSFGVKPIEVD